MDPTLLVSPFGRVARPTFVVVLTGVLLVLVSTLGLAPARLMARGLWLAYVPFYWALFCLMARRLHDSGRSAGWVALLGLPLMGPAGLLVLLMLGSTVGPNRFGADPYALHLLRRKGAA